jgi:cold shock CspA family protein
VTGRIRSLGAGNGSGCIAADNGTSPYFRASSVLAYDATCLAVGQLVTFDIGEDRSTAINVCVQRQHRISATIGKPRESAPLRYVGFSQEGGMREYRFERLIPGAPTETLTVLADLAIFRIHHVGIQDGPALCLRAIEAGTGAQRARRVLSAEDVQAHLSSRPAPRARPRHLPPRRHI